MSWDIRVRVSFPPVGVADGDAAAVAAMFGLSAAPEAVLYDGWHLRVQPGQLVAVVGHSGSGKTSLLRAVARRFRSAVELPDLTGDERPAIACLDRPDPRLPAGADVLQEGSSSQADLAERLEVLSRCGLAEATTLVTPARRLSSGQQFRLSLATGLWEALRSGSRRGRLLLIDEFAASLDALTAAVLAQRLRKLVSRYRLAALVSTPRTELLADLAPDCVVVKPLGEPARVLDSIEGVDCQGGHADSSHGRAKTAWPCHPAVRPGEWRIEEGAIGDYRALGQFHYLAGPPRGHKRVWTVRVPSPLRGPAGPEIAAVLVIAPPVALCRGRNVATGGRYAGGDRAAATERLNREVETIARVVVHPIFRGCGLAVRLVRHAIAQSGTPLVEAMAAMGAVHPFFELAGMTAYRLPASAHAARLLSAADAVGLTAEQVAAIEPVRRVLGLPRRASAIRPHVSAGGYRSIRAGKRAGFLRAELDRFIAAAFADARRRRLAAAGDDTLLAEACRAAAAAPVYYLAQTNLRE